MKPVVLIVRGGTRDRGRYNYRLHEGFFEQAFSELGYDVVHFGQVARGTEAGPYDYRQDVNEVVRRIKPAFALGVELDPPRYLNQIRGIPKVAYVCDLHRLRTAELLLGANLLLVRAKRFETTVRALPLGNELTRVAWLPFSVDEREVNMALEPTVRVPRVVFAGGHRREPWPVRKDALRELKAAQLLYEKSTVKIGYRYIGSEYFRLLKTCLLGLACSTRWKLNPAKHVEIPACGTVLLTDGSPGMERFLPKELYLTYTPQTIVSLVKSCVSDPVRIAETREMGKLAQAWIMTHHTNKVRARELGQLLLDAGIVGSLPC